MEWLNFRHLLAFWAVCRFGGFGRAGEHLGVSQSTVSQQVAQLEKYLGQPLIDRSTRTVRVTDAGDAVLAEADAIFARSAAINRRFLGPSEESGVVRVGLVGGVSRNFLYRRIRGALDGAARSRLEVVDGSFDDLSALLRAFELDVLFSLHGPRPNDRVTMTSVVVATSPLRLVGTREALSRCGQEPVELYSFAAALGDPAVQAAVADVLGSDEPPAVRTDDVSLLRFLANGGRGVALIPEIGVREDLDAGRVVALDRELGTPVQIHAIYLARGGRSVALEDWLSTD
jgi:LysR family transcriptional activator of nhaA